MGHTRPRVDAYITGWWWLVSLQSSHAQLSSESAAGAGIGKQRPKTPILAKTHYSSMSLPLLLSIHKIKLLNVSLLHISEAQNSSTVSYLQPCDCYFKSSTKFKLFFFWERFSYVFFGKLWKICDFPCSFWLLWSIFKKWYIIFLGVWNGEEINLFDKAQTVKHR